jgi:hypothetical protein
MSCQGPVAETRIRSATLEDLAGAAAVTAVRAASESEEVRLGWHVEVGVDFVAWYDCTSEHVCSMVARRRASDDLVGIETAGEALIRRSDGFETVELRRLRFKPLAPTRMVEPPRDR